jgi:hypothetical protein
MKATTVYRIYSGHNTASKRYENYVFTTADEQTAADYIENRRNAYAQAGLPCCPWFYEQHTTTT